MDLKTSILISIFGICFVYGCIEKFYILRPLKWKLLKYLQGHYPDIALNLEWFNFKPFKGIPNEGEIIIFSFWNKYHTKYSIIFSYWNKYRIKDTEIDKFCSQI